MICQICPEGVDIVTIIKQLRKRMGLTQQELANALKIAQGTLSNYETGRYEPDTETLKSLASFFKVSVDELIGYVPERNTVDLLPVDIAISIELKDLTIKEKEEVLEFVRFKRIQRLKREAQEISNNIGE